MSKTTVINLTIQFGDVYIGRGSIWGNPYKIGRDGTREECIEKYRTYLTNRLQTEAELKEQLLALDGKRLACYCKPLPCHGTVILECLVEVLGGQLIDEFTAQPYHKEELKDGT